LTDTLGRAERDGLITRHLDAERVDTATLYELTDLGRSLDEPLAALDRWVEGTGKASRRLAASGTGAPDHPDLGAFVHPEVTAPHLARRRRWAGGEEADVK
jgi:hypothetical protein